MRYSEYTGRGTGASAIWPVGSGSMAETAYSIPVYRGWPERPYKVLGSIRFEDPHKFWDDGVIRMAASMGRSRGGDAIIMRQGSEFGVGKITGAKSDPSVFSFNQTTALAIKWLCDAEIAAEAAKNRAFLNRFAELHPDLSGNSEPAEIAILFLKQQGIDPYSDDMLNRFSDLMKRVSAKANDQNISGEWLYKGTISTSSLVSSADETPIGVAMIRSEGENIVIISTMGKTELSFNGSLNKGRVAGQLGIGGFTAKCEGAALSGKISLSFQSLTSDGVVRGNLIFQRPQITIPPQKTNEKTTADHSSNRWIRTRNHCV